jgi:hypothetical protein
MASIRVALAYFLIAFAAGLAFGVFRTLILAPKIGDFLALAIELPLILGVCWTACGYLLRRTYSETPAFPDRLVIASVSLGLLLGAEFLLGNALLNKSISQQVTDYNSASGLAGLLAQLAFATFPLIRSTQ